jgi:NADP-dependent 3-hydroxy acid dehydrogenase YdfG
VALLARNPANFESLVKEINAAGGKAIGISTDATDNKSVVSAFEQIKKELGDQNLAAAIYNVGGKFVRKPFLELTEDDMEAGWAANGCVKGCSGQSLGCLLMSELDEELPISLVRFFHCSSKP